MSLPVSLEELGNKKYIRVVLGYCLHSTLESTPRGKTLLMTELDFLRAVKLTLPEWTNLNIPHDYILPIMEKVKIDLESGPQRTEPRIPIRLEDYIIRHSDTRMTIHLPLGDFVFKVLDYLQKNPHVRAASELDQGNFLIQWLNVVEQLRLNG